MKAINSFEIAYADSKLPKEIELIPSGEIITGFDGRVFKAIDKQAIIDKTNSKLKYVVIDENHKIDYTAGTGQSTEAMGWMHDFFVKEDGSVWASVEWTYSGAIKIENKEYKYISPVYEVDKSNNILSILRAAITNNPNLKLTALNNKQKQGDAMNKEINNALSLSENASESEVLTAINNFKKENDSLKAELNAEIENKKALTEKNESLEKALNEVNKELAEIKKTSIEKEALSVVEKAINEGKIAPATKDVYVSLCMETGGIEKFNKIMESTPKAKLFEESNIPSKTDKNISLNEADEKIAAAMGYTKEEMLEMKKKENN